MIENGSLSSFNETKSLSTKAIWLLVTLTVLFCGFQIISNISAIKIIGWDSFYVPAASLYVVFFGLLSDSISNIYGSKIMKKVTYLGIICNILLALCCALVVILPTPSFNDASVPNAALSQSIRLVVFGVIALYISQNINAIILQKIKKKQVESGKDSLSKTGIFIRSYVSSLPSVCVDCIIFCFGSWFGIMTIPQIIVLIISQIIIKLGCELILQACLSSWIVPKLVNYAGVDEIEETTASFNPFKA